MTPKLSGGRAELFSFSMAKSLLTTLEVPHTNEELQKVLPCKSKMEELVRLLARSIILVGAHRLQEDNYREICLRSDQAEEKVKKGTGKIITKWCVSLATEEFPD